MNKIRKIWIGKDVKEDSMSWHVGQDIRLGKNPKDRGTVEFVEDNGDNTFTIYVKKGDSVIPWKKTGMNVTVEYDLIF